MNELGEKKGRLITYSVIATAMLIMLTVGATFAYFATQGGTSANQTVTVKTGATDQITFSEGTAVEFTVKQSDFTQGGASITKDTTSLVKLTAGSEKATHHYKVEVEISSTNKFVNTTTSPELLLRIYKKVDSGSESEVTSDITNLGSYNSTGVVDGASTTQKGYDIANITGKFTVASSVELIANASATTTHTWRVAVTFVNLKDTDQQANTSKDVNVKIILTKVD